VSFGMGKSLGMAMFAGILRIWRNWGPPPAQT
jgi:hypothetical protein